MTQQEQDPVFSPGKADWIQDEGAQHLDRDQKALLLALTQLEAEIGRHLSEEERAAIDALADPQEGFDPAAIKRAVRQMVNAPTDPDRTVSWTELKDHRYP